MPQHPLLVKAILFDLDDTLFDHRHSSRAALAAIQQGYACFELKTLDELECDYARLLEELHPLVLQGVLTIQQARIERFRRLFAECEEDALAPIIEAAAASYRQAYQAARRPVPGAVQLLANLESLVRIAIVSNNLVAEQRDKLQCCGLERFADELVVSEEVGVSKPCPEIFQVALSRVECSPQEAVMVGDSWKTDVLGAHHIGIWPVWLNRQGLACPDTTIATEIRSFEPLADVCELLLNGKATNLFPQATI
jgi:putative hydrolase of the HAD superfamily